MGQDDYRHSLSLEARVHQLEAMMDALLARLEIDPAEIMPEVPSQANAIHEALLAGNKILAIKLYRELYGVGLKEAKDAVDAMVGYPRR